MEDNQTTGVEQETAAQAQASYGSYQYHNTSIVRDEIADRTGELMDTAFDKAAKHMRVEAGAIKDPRDGTMAHFQLSAHGIMPIPAEAFDQYRLFPLFRTGTSKHTQLTSFIDLVNRFRLPHSVIYACDNMAAPKLTAIFDYHPANSDLAADAEYAEADETPTARNQNLYHRAEYDFPLSAEWKTWLKWDGTPMAMGDFARFLEDNIVNVSADPVEIFAADTQAFVKANRGTIGSPSKLIEISRSFRVYENAVVKQAKNLTTGESQFTFDVEHTDGDGKPINVPTMFSILIPVFARSIEYFRLIARLRYRKSNEGLTFWYELWRPDLTFETAFNEALTEVRRDTKLPVYIGTPETT